MLEVLADYVLYPIGIYALIALPIILILYFLKKKVKTIALPSFMFLLAQQGKVRKRWFPKLPFNWLFIIHVLLALTLAAAILQPFYTALEADTKDEVALIIDTSASMQVNGFLQAKQEALASVSKINTIIINAPKPKILLKQGSSTQAKKIITALKVSDAPGSLEQAISLMPDLNMQNAAVHIFSDFHEDVLASIQRAGNNIVIPHEFSNDAANVGIVEAKILESNVSMLIKNYNRQETVVTIDILGSSQEISIPADEFLRVSLPFPNTKATVTLRPNDPFPVDNTLYLTPPPEKQARILYITDKPNKYTNSMLDVINFVNVEHYTPPGVIDMSQYDGFLIENLDASKLLPSNIEDMLNVVEQGGVLIIKASDKLENLNIEEEFPYTKMLPKTTQEVEILPNSITENLATISKESLFPIELRSGATTLMQTLSGQPVIASRTHGDGTILYYGIDDASPQSTFKLSYAYPILFQRTMQKSFDILTLSDIHISIGEDIISRGQIQTPKDIQAGPLTTQYAGYYTSGNKVFAANLLDKDESNINAPSQISEFKEFFKQRPTPVSISPYLLMFAAFLLLIEFFFIKQRGDY